MTESDDEIYKKAYADEQERIRIEGIKAKAQEDAKHASLGLSPRHKKSRFFMVFFNGFLVLFCSDFELVHQVTIINGVSTYWVTRN